jgi:hypothetical protein
VWYERASVQTERGTTSASHVCVLESKAWGSCITLHCAARCERVRDGCSTDDGVQVAQLTAAALTAVAKSPMPPASLAALAFACCRCEQGDAQTRVGVSVSGLMFGLYSAPHRTAPHRTGMQGMKMSDKRHSG